MSHEDKVNHKLAKLIANIKNDNFFLKTEFYEELIAGTCNLNFHTDLCVKDSVRSRCFILSNSYIESEDPEERALQPIYREGYERITECDENLKICDVLKPDGKMFRLFISAESLKVVFCVEMTKN